MSLTIAPYHCDYFVNKHNGMYHCEARGGYPVGELFWIMNDGITKTSTLSYKDHHTGLYDLSSDLPINNSTTQGQIHCMVGNLSCNQG